jgi:hypothetical protein
MHRCCFESRNTALKAFLRRQLCELRTTAHRHGKQQPGNTNQVIEHHALIENSKLPT